MLIQKIVITGGPCAGKTTAMSWIQNAFSARGYRVLFIPETATEFISGGVAPWTCGTNLEYQKVQMALQIKKEELFMQAAQTMGEQAQKILIVCDRGAMDNKAYMTQEEFDEVLRYLDLHEIELRDNYDGVFHLVTAANGALEAYSSANNAARYETAEEAVKLDDRLIAAWSGHPHMKIIDNSTGFDRKMHRLLEEISRLPRRCRSPMPMSASSSSATRTQHGWKACRAAARWRSSRPICSPRTAATRASASAAKTGISCTTR